MTSPVPIIKCIGISVCLFILFSEVSGQQCPAGWLSRKGDQNCYYISTKKQRSSFTKVKQVCQNAKGSLLKIDSLALKNWIYAIITRRIKADPTNTRWWVGLSRTGTRSPWKWTDGTALNTQLNLWGPGQPDNAGFFWNENCASLTYDRRRKNVGMTDATCYNTASFICQTTAEIPSFCDTDTIQGWDRINNVCYKYMDYLRPWADAKASCEGAGGQLASPGDKASQQVVQTYAKTNHRDVWINSISQPIQTNPKYQFVWSNTTAVSTTFWARGEPKVQKGQENSTCVKVLSTAPSANSWKADLCDNENQYVCSKVPGGCAPGWTPFSRWCYQFNYLALLSWSEANRYCQTQGAVLMEITTKDQQTNFLVPFLENLQQSGIPSIWIGMSDTPGKAGAFRWTSGAQISYQNWAQTFPNDTKSKQDCAVIYTDDDKGKWSTTPNCLQPKGFLCQSNKNDVIHPVSTPAPTYSCDAGWVLNGQKCYKFNNQPLSWLASQTNCQQSGGRLAYILDGDTQTFIIKNVKQDTWFGLNDRAQNGKYVFGGDTNLVSFTNWDNKQPAANQDWNCGLVSGAAGHKGKWKITDCLRTYPFMCDKDPNNIPPTIGPTTSPVTWSTNCGPFWDENPLSGYCYMFVNRPLSWRDARNYCNTTDNSDLASITNLDEQNYISGRLTSTSYLSYWVGGNDLNSEGGWEWSDGSGFAFMNWAKGQPDDWQKRQDCLRVELGRFKAWDDASCGNRFPFICKKPGKNARPLPTGSTLVEPVCGEGWKVSGSACYEFNQKRATWAQARATCMREGGDMAIVNDLTTQALINANIKIESWIGLNDRFKEKTFIWNNNNKTGQLPYTNWLQGQPDHKKDQDCVTVMTSKHLGKWRDNKCNGKWGFICQKPASCGDNWYLYGQTCYLFNTSGATWAGARKQCKDMGADLVTIKTAGVQSFLTGKLLRESWTGLNDQIKNKQYTWLDSTDKLPFKNWAKGQPDSKDNADCGTIVKTSGTWRDRSCTQQYGFICQKSAADLLLGCPNGWLGFEGHCYLGIVHSESVTWQNARSVCLAHSADLVSITSQAEQQFVFSHMAYVKGPAWIGLSDIDNSFGHRMFEWTDKSPVTVTNWAKTEPNNKNGWRENCVAINRDKHGGWEDYPCDSTSVKYYMCKMEMKPTVVTTPSPMQIGCKSGLGLFATCYIFVTDMLSFDNAEKYCVSKFKGHLATISSRYVQAFLTSELADRQGYWWIGLSNSDPKTYTWTSGQTLGYAYWDSSHKGSEAAGGVIISANKPIGLWKNQAKKTTKYPFICESARTGTYNTPAPDKPTPNPFANCPTYYKEYTNGYCYRAYYSSGRLRKTWQQARAYCQQFGGDLVSFQSQDEHDFVVKNVVGRFPGIFWIGINDIDQEKGFRWSDGSPVGYTNWMPNQPDDHKHHEDCGEYNKNSNAWNDDNCNIAKSFICKAIKGAAQNQNVITPTQGPVVKCSGQLRRWTFYKNMCYYVSYSRKSFFDARRWCQIYGGELVSIHNHDESDYVISKITTQSTNSFWIGLNDIGENGYNWTDSSPVDFINWLANEPNDMYGQQSCVHMIRDGFWQDNNCGSQKRYICKAHNGTVSGTIPPRTTMTPGNCPQGFFGMDSRCYIIKGDTPADQVNWTIAVNRCKQMGNGILLATISNHLEQSFITSNLQAKKYNVWIGLSDQAVSNEFVWLDNSKVTYTNWARGEPNGYHGFNPYFHPSRPTDKENCVEVFGTGTKTGFWNDKSCSVTQGYVCQAMRSTSNPIPVTSPLPAYCKPGYVAHGTSCYKLDTTKRTWSDASTACKQDGGNLVSITSKFEQAFVITLIHTNQSTVWIGLSQTQETGLYDWSDNWPVMYSNWAYGEPSRNGQTCVYLITRNGQWRDATCNYKVASVCKINPGTPPHYTTRPPGYCADSTWVQNGDYCYYGDLALRNMKSWPEAQYICSKKGMALATIRSKADNDFLLRLLRLNLNQRFAVWIGLYAHPDGGFQWQDNSAVDYVNWAKSEPSNNRTRTSEDCVAFSTGSGGWYDTSCLTQLRYVCSTLKVIPTRVTRFHINTTKSTPLPVITQVSGNPQTSKPSTVTKKVVPITTKNVRPPVTVHHKTPPSRKTGPPKRTTPHKPPVTFAPTQNPHTFFPLRTNPPITQGPPIRTRRPFHQRFQGNSNNGSGISGGGIAGVCIAVILAAALVTVGILYYRRRQATLRLQTTVGFDNALYNRTGENIDLGGND